MNSKGTIFPTLFVALLLISMSFSSVNGIDYIQTDLRIRSENRDYWPTEGWRDAAPEDLGMNSTKLQGLVDYVEDNNYPIHSVVVIKSGYIVLEDYFGSHYDENATHLLYSVTKSFTSAMVGIAIDQGYIENVSQLLLPFFPEYTITNVDDRRELITIEHLLTMRAGMAWDETSAPYSSPENDVYHIYRGDGVNHSLNLDMVANPGDVFHYNTGASHLLSAIVQVATGMSTLDFATANLFEPLGISPVYWAHDLAGWTIGGFDLRISARNMAKFGWLFLNNGTWDGEQIISKDWVRTSTSTITDFGNSEGYGYQWWTMPELGIYFAAGLYGQYIYVIPEEDIVVAFNSGITQGEHPHLDLILNYILNETNTNLELDESPIFILVLVIVPIIAVAGYWLFSTKRKIQ
ncbi:MAG: serine hydrolase domain-containing protein [Candidatus Thorarchaeota archaeon]